jgi:hypothetical protein
MEGVMAPFTETPDGMSPAILELLDKAFSATWLELQARSSSTTSESNEQAIRTAIDKSIRDLAATGVRDQDRLKRHGLHAAELAKPRTRAIVHLPE